MKKRDDASGHLERRNAQGGYFEKETYMGFMHEEDFMKGWGGGGLCKWNVL